MFEQEEVLDEQTPKEEQVEPAPEVQDEDTEAEPDKSLEDELALMSAQELKDFAARMLTDKREANAEASKSRKASKKSQDELAEIRAGQTKLKREAELASMEESDAMKAKLADSEADLAEERSKRQKSEVENAILTAATRLKFIDPADAANNIDIQTVLVDGRLDQDALDAQVESLAETKPYLVETPKRSPAFESPASPRSSNGGQEQVIVDRLKTGKAKALEAEQQRFQHFQSLPGKEAQLQAVISFRKLTAMDSKIATGKYMKEAMAADGRRRGED